jgi:hypothetical protein
MKRSIKNWRGASRTLYESLEARHLLAGNLTAQWTADDLLAQLPEGGTIAAWQDSVAGIGATSSGSPALLTGQAGGRALVSFDASDGADSLFIDARDNPLTGAGDFSVAVAFRSAANTLQGANGDWFRNTGIVDANQLGLGRDWGLSINAAGQLSTGMGGGLNAPPRTVYSAATALNDGQMHIAVVTRQGSTLALYIDQLAAVQISDANAEARGRLDMVLGALTNRTTGFTGEIGQVRLYDGVLTTAEVAALESEMRAYYSNSPPVAGDDEYSVQEDALLFVSQTSQGILQNDLDADADSLAVVLVEGPQHGDLVLNANGTFVYDSDPNFFGVDTFTYVATDFRASNVATVTLSVESVRDPAVAVADSYKLRPGQTLRTDAATGVLSNDVNPDQATLTAKLVNDVSGGDLTLRDDGSFVYDSTGFAGLATFTYQVDDGVALSAPVTVSFVVNSPPIGRADALVVTEDVPLVLTGPGGILDNDSDDQSEQVLQASIVTQPTHGTVESGLDGSLMYVPGLDYVGADSFTYRISDGFDTSAAVNVTLDVQPVNDAPSINGDAYFVLPGGNLVVSPLQGVLATDTDVEGDPLTASLVAAPLHGTLELAADGSFRYTPQAGFIGDDVFTYRASDGQENSLAEQVVISVVQQPLVINELLALNTSSLATRTRAPEATRFSGDDQWFDWVEIHNRQPRPLDLGGLHLTDDPTDPMRWAFPPGTVIPANGYLVVFASGLDIADPARDELGLLHTNFRLGSGGEYLALTNLDGAVISAFVPQFASQATNISYGWDGQSLRYFTEVTPAAANGQGLIGLTGGVTMSAPHGFFTDSFSLSMESSDPAATIRFTTDGSEPTESNGTEYQSPITIASTTVVRAAAFRPEYVRSPVTTQTYLFLGDVVRQSPDGAAPAGWPDGPLRGQVFDYGMDPEIVDDATWGPQLIGALQAIPSISLVTEQAHLTDPQAGIYVNASQDGRAWERPASFEVIQPNGVAGLQIDAGLRIRGGFSRGGFNPKHSFRLFFRDEYGGTLDVPMFGDEGVDSFENLDLRTAQNYAWSNDTFNDQTRNSFLRDVFSRDLQRQQGQPYTRSRYYHLYLNGQYWGLYQTEERPEASFAESYLGGNEDNYDVIKASGGTLEATDGVLDRWTELWQLANAGFTTLEEYFRIQGRNADGSENPDLPVHIRSDALIDFMINVMFTGNEDMPTTLGSGDRPNNFYAIRDPNTRDGWQLIAHDNEHNMLNINYDHTRDSGAGRTAATFNPKYLHQQLDEFSEYQIEFADRVQQLFFNNGPLTPENAQQLMQSRADQIDQAIIAESARWGDQHNEPPLTKNTWQAEVDWLLNTFLARRRDIVMDQLKGKGLYPMIDAPSFNQHGGTVDRGFVLDISAPQGTIWYTLDGSDPRMIGGALNPAARAWDGAAAVALAADTRVQARARVGDQWSALTTAEFLVGAAISPTTLRISELHYHPAAPSAAEQAAGFEDADDFEFIELLNVGQEPIDLSSVRLVQAVQGGTAVGVAFDFATSPLQRLAPGARALVVEDAAAFRLRYGNDLPVAGQWTGGLGNGGERIEIWHAEVPLQQFTYDDAWHPSTDGVGYALEVVDPQATDLSRWGRAEGWRASLVRGGTPGREPALVAEAIGDVNGDGVFNSSDLVAVFQAGEYEDAIASNSTYTEGDWNDDGDFTTADLVLAFQSGSYVAASRRTAAIDAVFAKR